MGGLEKVFETVIELGYASTWVILAVFLLRCALRRMPKKYSYMLWAIPAVRLLIPIPFAGVWGMLGSLAKHGGGRLFVQVMDILGSPLKLANLVAGKWAAGGMPGSMSMPAGIGGRGIWDKVAQIGSNTVSQVAELANGIIGGGVGRRGLAMSGDSAGLSAGSADISLAGKIGSSNLAGGNGGVGLSGGGNGISLPGDANGMSRLGETNGISLFGEMPVISVGTIQLSLVQAAAILWLVGMIVFAGWNVVSYVRLRRKLRISVRWEGQAYLADGIRQPFVLPGFPSRIYLPSGLGVEGISNILRHEQIHVRRKDPWLNLLAAVLLGIYWFHPAVWLGVHYFRRDMEMSCDEAAVAGLDAEGVKAYILDLLRFSVSREKWAQFPCGFGEKGVVGRMKNLKKEKVRTKAALLAAGALVVATALILIPNARGSGEGEAEQNVIEKGQDLAAHGVSIEKRKVALGQEPGVEMVLPEDGKESGAVRDPEDAEEAEDAQEAQDTQQIRHIQEPEGLRESLEQYFADFCQTLSDSSRNYTPEDFASTDGYIAWKILENLRNLGDELYGGISDVEIKELSIDDIFEAADGTEVMVYLNTAFSYQESPEEWEERREMYRVSVMQAGDSYQVRDLDLMSSEADLVKDILGLWNTPNVESNYDAVDAYFKEGHMY